MKKSSAVLLIIVSTVFISCCTCVGGGIWMSYLEVKREQEWARPDPEGYKKAMAERAALERRDEELALREREQRLAESGTVDKGSDAPPSAGAKLGEWTLQSDNGSPIPVALSKSAHEELLKFSVAHDLAGVSEMISAERVYLVDAGTRIRRLQGVTTCEIRILNGAHAGKVGWVAGERLTRK